MRVFQVNDQDGKELALFMIDSWKRDNKNGGAWMSNLVNQSYLRGTRPVVYNVQNFTKPAAGPPTPERTRSADRRDSSARIL